jgi:hemerythrin-like metal-binding protein
MAKGTALLTWRTAYNTKIAEIDRQHHELAALLNRLHRSLKERAGRVVVRPMVSELLDRVTEHFITEERLMEEAGYPKASHHRLEHALLRTRARNFQRAYSTERTPDPMHTLLFLRDWFDKHVQGADQLMAEYVTQHDRH